MTEQTRKRFLRFRGMVMRREPEALAGNAGKGCVGKRTGVIVFNGVLRDSAGKGCQERVLKLGRLCERVGLVEKLPRSWET